MPSDVRGYRELICDWYNTILFLQIEYDDRAKQQSLKQQKQPPPAQKPAAANDDNSDDDFDIDAI
ncbi:hypothetical protein EAI_00699 [Harpegnathos saltator]|uniref:Uncharacterized protein n=1 Tax=Harpegnathos saltator TaxID=610380 RepID=E2C4S5_HARSA|nr:hypothetical protein EAI_00699 [Harpegnathos saltator]